MEILHPLILAFIAILPVVNPFSKPPIFLSITEGLTPQQQRRQALKASIYAFLILIVSLMAGTFILAFFSISLPALQIAGGLLIARTGFQMLNPKKENHQTAHEEQEAKEMDDISFVPLAMPLLSGPGAIAVMINLATGTHMWTDWLLISIASAAVCVITFFVLAESTLFLKFLGVNGMNALSKLMGFLLLSLAIQFIINGVTSTLTQFVATMNSSSQ